MDKKPTLAKTSIEYWKIRVAPRKLPNNGKSSMLYMRIKENGRSRYIALNLADKTKAASKARDIWIFIAANGLDAYLAMKGSKDRPEMVCTIGEYIQAAKRHTNVRSRSFAQYEAALKRIVAGVANIPTYNSRYEARSEANKAWHDKINAIRLDKITPTSVKLWQKSQIDLAVDEKDRIAKIHTVSSHLRNARALFSEATLAELKKTLILPTELPFEGVVITATTRRFECTIDPKELYRLGISELKNDELIAFLLLLIGGLRRGEADLLPWAHIDFKALSVRIDSTAWFTPKTAESYRTIRLNDHVVKILADYKLRSKDQEFVLNGKLPSAPGAAYEYRASAWSRLIKWLRAKGIDNNTPLHTLRKMSGSIIYQIGGPEASRKHLGHSSYATTAASYIHTNEIVIDLNKKEENA